jgi:hypothetical protein
MTHEALPSNLDLSKTHSLNLLPANFLKIELQLHAAVRIILPHQNMTIKKVPDIYVFFLNEISCFL